MREAVQPPELTQEEGHYHVVSKADGIVTRVETMDGEAAVKEGDTVTEGEILISGTVTHGAPHVQRPAGALLPDPRPGPGVKPGPGAPSPRPSRSTAQVKAYTGEEKSRLYPDGPGTSAWNFIENAGISWPWYDKISTVYQAGLPGGLDAPPVLDSGDGTGPMSPSRRRWTAPPPRLCWRSACWRS